MNKRVESFVPLTAVCLVGGAILATIAPNLERVLAPGAWVVSWILFWKDEPLSGYYGFRTAIVIGLVVFLARWWVRLALFRLVHCALGRKLGLYNPNHYHLWTYLWLPWRSAFLGIWLRFAGWREENFDFGRGPTAGVASYWTCAAALYRPGNIYLGRIRIGGIGGFQPVGISEKDDRHLFMIAGTSSGKSNHLCTLLGLHEGNAYIPDPKGQLTRIMAPRMGKGGNGVIGKGKKVCILDPSGITGYETSYWNPWDEVERARKRAIAARRDPDDTTVEFIQKIVDGLVVLHGKSDPFWPGAGKDFTVGVGLWMDKHLPREECTLAKLYELVTIGLPEKIKGDESGVDALLCEMLMDPSYGGIIASSAAGIADGGANTTGSVLITLREQLKWLKRPGIRRVSSRSTFSLEELHDHYGDLVLFIVGKLSDLSESYAGWFRLLTVSGLAIFEDINMPVKSPCLFALEEFANYGKIQSLSVSASYMRSFGVRLLCIIQNIGQLKEAGYENWETFIGNAAVCWWMKTNHSDNLAYLEARMGKSMVKEKLDGPEWWQRPFSNGITRHGLSVRDVMTSDQIRRFMARGNMIVTRDQRAFLLKPDPYFRALPVCFYSPVPEHREKLMRRITRSLIAESQRRAEKKMVVAQETT